MGTSRKAKIASTDARTEVEPAVEDRLVVQDLLQRVGQAGLGQNHSRAEGNIFVDHPVRRQVDEAEPAQLA